MEKKWHLLLGRAGSGKSHCVFERLTALARADKTPLILLVPEQYSFESERTLLLRLGAEQAARIQVLSFSRLADVVFRQTGGLASEQMDDGTRALLMSRALEQVAAIRQDDGSAMAGLRPHMAVQGAYVEQLLALWEEMKQCAIPTDALERAATELEARGDSVKNGLLQEKTADLYRVFTAYEGLVKHTGLEDVEPLCRLAERLPDSSLPDGAYIFVDGFKGFTMPEYMVLERLLPRVQEMTVALCTDTPGKQWPGVSADACRREYPLFAPVTDTVRALQEMAARHGGCWELELLDENHRAAEPALAALEAGLYSPMPTVFEGDASAVTVTPCEDVYEECAYVARCIRRLLRQEGYRCRDIVVTARDLSPYQGLLQDALEAANIPCYMDARQDLLSEPLVVYVRAALRLAVGGWRTEEIWRLLKTDLTPLSPVDIAQLENYVYMWRLDGARWDKEWTDHPDGLDAKVTPQSARRLAVLNGWRRQIIEPLQRLRQAIRGNPTGRAFAQAVYDYLATDDMVAKQVAVACSRLEQLAEPVLAAHAARVWEELIDVLDRFAAALGDQRLPASRLEELFGMLCGLMDLGTIPKGLDAVTVGAADRMRFAAPRAVFVLGANEGVFPAYPSMDGLLTDEERTVWEELGLRLSGDLLHRCVEERYYAYVALCAPSHRLTVTYHTAGEAMPSPLVGAIETILPRHTRVQAHMADGEDAETEGEMFACLAQTYQQDTSVKATLKQVLRERPAYEARLAALHRAVYATPFHLEDTQTAQRLYGRDLCLSASQTETFYRCHFAYFCRYGLQVRPRAVAQVDAAAFGTVVHHVMETLLPQYTAPEGLLDALRARKEDDENAIQADLMARLQTDVQACVDAYLREHMGGAEGKSGRFLYQMGLAQRSACNMLWHTVMELRQGRFKPADFELAIYPEEESRPDGGVLSLRVPFSQGSIQLRGKVDRVDLFVREDGSAFARVVDYKTGTKTFDLYELTAGLSMQMLLYLFIVCDNSARYVEEGQVVSPAGVLYHPLSDLVVKRGESLQEKQLKSMRMSGLVLDEPSVILAMEPEGQKHFIPAALDAKGQPKGDVVSASQFALLRGVVEQLLVQMGENLLQGDIEACPVQVNDHLPCEYCDYRAVCAREPEDAVRVLEKRSAKAVLEELEEEKGVSEDGAEMLDD